MQAWWEGSAAAFQLLVMLVLGWLIVFLAAQITEQRVGRKRRSSGAGGSALGWLWSYSNLIGIATLLCGAAYLVWSTTWGPGLSGGPTMLVILLMLAAGFLIGFAPALRR